MLHGEKKKYDQRDRRNGVACEEHTEITGEGAPEKSESYRNDMERRFSDDNQGPDKVIPRPEKGPYGDNTQR